MDDVVIENQRNAFGLLAVETQLLQHGVKLYPTDVERSPGARIEGGQPAMFDILPPE